MDGECRGPWYSVDTSGTADQGLGFFGQLEPQGWRTDIQVEVTESPD